MKKSLPFLLLLLCGCSATRNISSDNNQVINKHSKPVKIFGIGKYNASSVVLTLVDADDHYFTMRVPNNSNFKVGSVYSE